MGFLNRPDEHLGIGSIIEVDGNRLAIELDPTITELTRVYKTEIYTIGQFGSILKVPFGSKLLFAFATRLRMRSDLEDQRLPAGAEDTRILEAELFGEGEWSLSEDGGRLRFERGVSTYPLPLQRVYLTTADELRSIYQRTTAGTVRIGTYVGTEGAPCLADIDELFGKHVGVLGSTGAGKSAAVTAILRAALGYTPSGGSWHPQVVILDPHDEYHCAFPEARHLSSDEGRLKLPYWLLNLQELIDLLLGKTEFQATSQSNIIKTALLQCRQEAAGTLRLDRNSITVDSPVPFSLERFQGLIDKERQELTSSKQDRHQAILAKLDALRRDRRLAFLMDDWTSGQDDIVAVIQQFVDPVAAVKIVDLSGIPSDVAGLVSAAVARLLFLYKLWQRPEERRRDPLLLVCEEAHRYVPNAGEAEYAAAQAAIRRIAKEGRKYGLGLMLVSQRPSEVDATVLSQCNSWVVLRLTNAEDQNFVVRFLPDSLVGLSRMLPALRRREAIFIGQAAVMPARIMIDLVPKERLPRSQDIPFLQGWAAEPNSLESVKNVASRWRSQVRAVGEGGTAEPGGEGE